MRERPSVGWVQETMMMMVVVVEGGWAAGCGTRLWNIRGTDAGGGPPDKAFLFSWATLRILGASVNQGRAPARHLPIWHGRAKTRSVCERGLRVELRGPSTLSRVERANERASQIELHLGVAAGHGQLGRSAKIHTLWQQLRPGNFAPFFLRVATPPASPSQPQLEVTVQRGRVWVVIDWVSCE